MEIKSHFLTYISASVSKFQNHFQEANKPPESWFELKVNPHIYVMGLPSDVTLEEVSYGHCFFQYIEYPKALKGTDSGGRQLQVSEVFSKCGIIKEVNFNIF